MASISTLVDRVKILVLSNGTGAFQLGSAVPAYRGVEALTDGTTYSYAVESGAQFEVGTGVYLATTRMLIRNPTLSSDGGSAVSFPANVQVNFTLLAQDVPNVDDTITVVQTPGTDPSVVMSQAAVTTAVTANIVRPVDETANMTAGGLGQNGGSFDAASGQITIPANQTGALSFATYYIDLQREMLRSGETVELTLVLVATTNFLAAVGESYVPRINAVVTIDGTAVEQIGQGTNLSVTQTTPNEIVLKGDYVIKGGETEKAGLSLQIGPASPISASERYFLYKSSSYSVKSMTDNTSAVVRRDSDYELTSGDLSTVVTNEGQNFNGGDTFDGGLGILVPAGSIGNVSYRRYIFDAGTIAENAGSTLLVTMLLRTTENFTDQTKVAGDITVWHGSTPNYNNAKTASVRKINNKLVAIEVEYTIVGDETQLGPYVQITGASVARTTEGSFALEQLYFTFAGYSFEGRSPSEQVVRWRERQIETSGYSGNVNYYETVNVNPDGSGDYTTLAAAIAARGAGKSFFNRILYRVHPGVYTDTNVFIPTFADILGVGADASKNWFRGELPDNVDPAVIPTVQTFWMNETSAIRNIKVTCRNMRYPIHSDSGASAYRATQVIEDCHVEHIGNQGARDYQISIGGDPNAVWSSEHAWGCGTHSGERIYSRRSTWVSKTSPWYFHTNADFAEPSYVEVEGGRIDCTTDTGNAIILQPLGSGQPDRAVFKSVDIRGPMLVAPTPWLSPSFDNQPGDRTAEIQIHMEGCDALPFTSFNGTSTNPCNVLELRSISTAGSSVAVSGSGALAIFGAQPNYVAGGVGFPGRVRSEFAITGAVAGLSLGARLGDCTSTNKTLNIVFDGTVNQTLTLNQNYTSMTNAQIVTALNTSLSGGARVFQELDVYTDANHLFQPEWEVTVLNTSGACLTKGMAVAHALSQYKAQAMFPGDPLSSFAGVVLDEVIIPGARGRILKPGGRMLQNQLAFSGVVSAAYADEFGISGTPGLLVEGALPSILRCVEVRNGQGVFRLLGDR